MAVAAAMTVGAKMAGISTVAFAVVQVVQGSDEIIPQKMNHEFLMKNGNT